MLCDVESEILFGKPWLGISRIRIFKGKGYYTLYGICVTNWFNVSVKVGGFGKNKRILEEQELREKSRDDEILNAIPEKHVTFIKQNQDMECDPVIGAALTSMDDSKVRHTAFRYQPRTLIDGAEVRATDVVTQKVSIKKKSDA